MYKTVPDFVVLFLNAFTWTWFTLSHFYKYLCIFTNPKHGDGTDDPKHGIFYSS